MTRRLAWAVVVLATAGLPASPGMAASPGTLSGKLTDGKLPAASAGRTDIRAIDVANGVAVASSSTSGTGAWKLALEPGNYVIAASVVQSGKAAVAAVSPIQKVRSGAAKRTTVSLKRKRAPKPVKKKRRKPARAAAAASPVVAVQPFTGSGPNASLGRGLMAIVISDLINTTSGDCDPTVAEWEHRADLQREIDLSNSSLSDPRTRIPSGHFLDPAFFVRGAVTTTASSTSWALQVVRAGTGEVVSEVNGSADGAAVFDASGDIAQQVADAVCGGDYRVRIEINAIISIPPYIGSGTMTVDLPVRDISGESPANHWYGRQDVAFSALGYGGVPGCVVVLGPHLGYAQVDIKSQPGGLILVEWGGETTIENNLQCPNAPPIPNGVPPILPYMGTQPSVLVFPKEGGSQNVTGGVGTAGGAWTNSTLR